MKLHQMTMRFLVSDDEEQVDIRLICGDRVTPLPRRSHHYLLLTLAEARANGQAVDSAGEADIGWVSFADLLDIHDMSEPTFNVYVGRARKDLAQAGVQRAMDLIERQPAPRRLRLGVRNVEIVRL
jgi:hypothetical protein